MKKTIGICIASILSAIFGLIIFNSKRADYELHKQFYESDFSGEVTAIETGRGTKISYDANDYFFSDFCLNPQSIENTVKVGDVIKKQDSIVEVFRGDDKNQLLIIRTIAVKPANTYISYFLF